jgi:hypothetical protein
MPQSPHAEKNDEGMGHARLAFSIHPGALRQRNWIDGRLSLRIGGEVEKGVG